MFMFRAKTSYALSTIGVARLVANDCSCLTRVFGPFWKCARIGERLSPYVSICCVLMAVSFHDRVCLLLLFFPTA